MSGATSEQKVRQVLNLIWLTERCMRLPRTTLAERAQWAAEMERARRELALIDPVPELPDDLARALVRARGPDTRSTAAGAASVPGAAANSSFRGVSAQIDRARHSYRAPQ